MTEEIWTIQKLLVWTTDFFNRKGVESPRRTAEVLLAHVLKMDRVRLYMEFDRPLGEGERADFREMVKRRAARVPTDYLTGRRQFFGHEFLVDERVLVPRPETEQLVELALSRLPGGAMEDPKFAALQNMDTESEAVAVSGEESLEGEGASQSPTTDGRDEGNHGGGADEAAEGVPACKGQVRLLDLCTGSGCVGISAALARPDLSVVATDVSEGALKVARSNAENLKVSDRVSFLKGDLFGALPPGEGRFHVIATNPPYVPRSVIPTLAPEVRMEPVLALDGGPDGLSLVRTIVREAPRHLFPGGTLCIEVGEEHESAMDELLSGAGFVDVKVDRDFAGLPRIASGRWPS